MVISAVSLFSLLTYRRCCCRYCCCCFQCGAAVTITDGVRIEATSTYVESHSNPASNTYRFTYRITITNESEDGSYCARFEGSSCCACVHGVCFSSCQRCLIQTRSPRFRSWDANIRSRAKRVSGLRCRGIRQESWGPRRC